MRILTFVGAFFLLIFGIIIMIATVPTLSLVALFTGNLTNTLIIGILGLILGIMMFASGLYTGVEELIRLTKEKKE